MPRPRMFERRTKIVCTIGPATNTATMIERLVRVGMNIARLNLSHGTFDEHAAYVSHVREMGHRLDTVVGVLMDLPGPKYRTGKLKGGQAVLKRGAMVAFTTEQIVGDASRVSVNLPELPAEVKPGDTVLLADGAMELRAEEIAGNDVRCRVRVGGVLTEERGLVVPGMRRSGPFITDALKKALLFSISQHPDYLALSFVTSADDVAGVRKLLAEQNADIPIISKIERGEAVKNFESILRASDGIMVARGDLGIEIPLERVPMVQKEIIRLCNRAGKPVITATEMLESMVSSVRPTRAEATDVANAVFDGTDATMLSEETSIGAHPLRAVTVMDRIARQAEKKLPYELALSQKKSWFEQQTEELISYNACVTAQSLDASAIVAFTESGSTAGRVSKYRPRTPVLTISPEERTCCRVVLHWGIYPIHVSTPASVSDLFTMAASLARDMGLGRPGDLVVITGGIPLGVRGTTNLLKVEVIR